MSVNTFILVIVMEIKNFNGHVPLSFSGEKCLFQKFYTFYEFSWNCSFKWTSRGNLKENLMKC